jgi:hypothetical protein
VDGHVIQFLNLHRAMMRILMMEINYEIATCQIVIPVGSHRGGDFRATESRPVCGRRRLSLGGGNAGVGRNKISVNDAGKLLCDNPCESASDQF